MCLLAFVAGILFYSSDEKTGGRSSMGLGQGSWFSSSWECSWSVVR